MQKKSAISALFLLKRSHLEHRYLFGCEEAPFAASDVLLGQPGEGNAVEVNHLVTHFLKHTAYDAVLSGVDLQADVMTVSLGELECIGDDTFVVKHHAGTQDRLINRVEVAVQRSGIDLFLAELRVRQLGCQITVVGQEQHTGSVAIETSHRIDTLGAGVTNNVDNGLALLGIIGSGDSVLGLVEQYIYLALAANGLVVEAHFIGRQDFCTERIGYLSVDGDNTGLDEIIGLTTAADTGVGKEFVQTNRFSRILMLLMISLLLAVGIESVVALNGLVAERTLRTVALFHVVGRTARALEAVGIESKGFRTTFTITGESGTLRDRSALTVETRTGSAFSLIVGIKHVLETLKH